MNKHTNKSTQKFFIILTLIVMAIFSRLVPHLPNMTALGAAALLAGASLKPRWVALVVPVVALLVSDWILGFYSGLWATYSAWILIVLGASFILPEDHGVNKNTAAKNWGRRGVAALFASVVFFIVSNFGVWAAGGLYPQTIRGLLDCYILAIPFAGTQIVGDLFFTVVLFGAADLLKKWVFVAGSTGNSAGNSVATPSRSSVWPI